MSLNDEFMKSPEDFYKKYPVNPADLHDNLGIDRMPGTSLFSEEYVSEHFTGDTVKMDKKGGIKVIEFSLQKDKHVEFKFENVLGEAKLFQCKTGERGIPMYYLPWESMKITKLELPNDTDVKYFLTAGLSGCSVFVRGTPAKPIVYHAGSSPSYQGDTVEFWRTCIGMVRDKSPMKGGHRIWGISKEDYRFGGSYGNYEQTEGAKKYERWLNSKYSGNLKIKLSGSLGCVFGMKNSRNEWAFYLQERVSYEVVELIKAEEGHTIVHEFQQTPLTGIGKTGLTWKKEVVKSKNIFQKSREVITGCEVKRYGGQPICVRQFFPSGGGTVSLTPHLTVD